LPTHPNGIFCSEKNYKEAPVLDTIEWFDGATISWRSEVGEQNGSNFTITKRGPIVGIGFEIKGKFSGKLFFGNKAKEITSGQFRIHVNLSL